MKLTNAILSIIILILSCMPCADIDADNLAHTASELASNQEKHSHDKGSDFCSPFCSCSCCGSQIAGYSQAITINFPISSTAIQTQLPDYKSIFTSSFCGSIWQPPQLV